MQTFNDIGALVAHLATIDRAVKEKAKAGLKKSAQLIEQTAKEKIGHYQAAVGPFNAWDQLAASTLAQHARMGAGDTPLLITGALRDSIQHEVDDRKAVIGSTMQIAADQEFGTDRIPSRPFMGPALTENKDNIEKIMGDAVFAAVSGGNGP